MVGHNVAFQRFGDDVLAEAARDHGDGIDGLAERSEGLNDRSAAGLADLAEEFLQAAEHLRIDNLALRRRNRVDYGRDGI